MMLDAFDQFRGVASDGGVFFYFSGEFTPAVVAALADTLRRRLDERGLEGPVRRRLFSTFVEMAQNILHYAAFPEAAEAEADGEAAGRRGVVALGATGDTYWLVCANPVPAWLQPRLEARLRALQGLTPEELREAYRRQLVDDGHERRDPLSRGAGLGLITMARACSAPLDWRFAPDPEHPDHLVTFSLCARMDVGGPPRSMP
jgi:hypothetical protein